MPDSLPAKRGMFCVVERRHSSHSLREGPKSYSEYLPAIVLSVTRDGSVKAVELAGGVVCKPDPVTGYCYIEWDARERVRDPKAFLAQLSAEKPDWNSWEGVKADLAARVKKASHRRILPA